MSLSLHKNILGTGNLAVTQAKFFPRIHDPAGEAGWFVPLTPDEKKGVLLVQNPGNSDPPSSDRFVAIRYYSQTPTPTQKEIFDRLPLSKKQKTSENRWWISPLKQLEFIASIAMQLRHLQITTGEKPEEAFSSPENTAREIEKLLGIETSRTLLFLRDLAGFYGHNYQISSANKINLHELAVIQSLPLQDSKNRYRLASSEEVAEALACLMEKGLIRNPCVTQAQKQAGETTGVPLQGRP